MTPNSTGEMFLGLLDHKSEWDDNVVTTSTYLERDCKVDIPLLSECKQCPKLARLIATSQNIYNKD